MAVLVAEEEVVEVVEEVVSLPAVLVVVLVLVLVVVEGLRPPLATVVMAAMPSQLQARWAAKLVSTLLV